MVVGLTGVLFMLTKVIFRLDGVYFSVVQFLYLAANHFTTVPCGHYTVKESHIFAVFFPLRMLDLEIKNLSVCFCERC